MEKYYQISIDSLITTFSTIESGKEFYFNIKSEQSAPQDITVDDKIIVSVEDKVYYEFIVTEISNDTVKLRKLFEISKSINLDFQTIGVFEQVNKDEYDLICSQLFSDFINEHSVPLYNNYGSIKEGFANWLLNLRKYSRVYKDDKAILIEKLNEYEKAYNNDFGIMIFDYPNVSIYDIINALESNVIEDLGEIGDLNKRTVGNGSVKAILGSQNYIKFLKDLLNNTTKATLNSPKYKPVNKIYFGAPGTRKSYQITQDLKDIDLIFQKRVTFHPEFDNASFIGGYKPITDINGNIKYEFVPQIFTNIYVEACNDPNHQYYLIIEEINRGNCAEIFGEIFQLLDRDINYKISPSNELINYLNSNISISKFYIDGKMLLPDNLSILATMNTSDQSLFPMDSAFKRRWEWEYIPINYTEEDTNASSKFYIKLDDNKLFKWIKIIEQINNIIKDNPSLGMDKCIGNYFVKPEKDIISLDTFIYKVIFYLWNDVFKDEPKNSIFKDNITYQDFFPIEDKGKNLVISMFKELNITETVKTEIE